MQPLGRAKEFRHVRHFPLRRPAGVDLHRNEQEQADPTDPLAQPRPRPTIALKTPFHGQNGNGVMECWSAGVMADTTPRLHDSTTPLLHHSISSLTPPPSFAVSPPPSARLEFARRAASCPHEHLCRPSAGRVP